MVYRRPPPSKILLFAQTLTICFQVELVLYFDTLNFQVFSGRKKEKRNPLHCVPKGESTNVSEFPILCMPQIAQRFISCVIYSVYRGMNTCYMGLSGRDKLSIRRTPYLGIHIITTFKLGLSLGILHTQTYREPSLL